MVAFTPLLTTQQVQAVYRPFSYNSTRYIETPPSSEEERVGEIPGDAEIRAHPRPCVTAHCCRSFG